MYLHEVVGRSGVAMNHIILCVLGLVLVQAGEKKCGKDLTCTSVQFCDSHGMCDDCARICDSNNNNYDKNACADKCKGRLCQC